MENGLNITLSYEINVIIKRSLQYFITYKIKIIVTILYILFLTVSV